MNSVEDFLKSIVMEMRDNPRNWQHIAERHYQHRRHPVDIVGVPRYIDRYDVRVKGVFVADIFSSTMYNKCTLDEAIASILKYKALQIAAVESPTLQFILNFKGFDYNPVTADRQAAVAATKAKRTQ